MGRRPRNRRPASLDPGLRSGQEPLEAGLALLVAMAQAANLAAQAVLIPQRQLAKRGLVDVWGAYGGHPHRG